MGASVLDQTVLRHLLGVERKKKTPHQPQFHIHKNILQMRVKYSDFSDKRKLGEFVARGPAMLRDAKEILWAGEKWSLMGTHIYQKK